MITVCQVARWTFGLFGLAFCLLTIWHLVYALSSQSAPGINSNVPCCGPYLKSALWNLTCLALFVLQHSGMATESWKSFLSRIGISVPIHRPLYVISTCLTLHLCLWNFSTLPGPPLWYFDVDEYPLLWLAVILVHCLMWFIIFAGALTTDPLELIGLKQFSGEGDGKKKPNEEDTDGSGKASESDADGKVTSSLEDMQSRHAGTVAFLVILWLHMAMSVERSLVAVVLTLYVLFGSRPPLSTVYVVQLKDK